MSTTQTWIAGQVVDAAGQPVAGVAVISGSGQQAAITGADGAFHIDGLLRGSHVLQARIDGAVGAMVVDARRGPAQGVAIRVPIGSAVGLQAAPDARTASIQTSAGTASVPAHTGTAPASSSAASMGGGGPSQPELGWIEGRVLDASGKAVAGARVSVSGGAQPARDIARLSFDGGRTRVGAWQPWRQASEAVSAVGGGYRVADVPPGPYVIEVRKGAVVGTAELTVRAGQGTRMDLRLA